MEEGGAVTMTDESPKTRARKEETKATLSPPPAKVVAPASNSVKNSPVEVSAASPALAPSSPPCVDPCQAEIDVAKAKVESMKFREIQKELKVFFLKTCLALSLCIAHLKLLLTSQPTGFFARRLVSRTFGKGNHRGYS